MKRILRVLVLSALAMDFCNAEPASAFQELPKTSVVVRINGRDVTKRDIERDAKMFMTLNMNKARRTKISGNEKSMFRRYCRLGGQIAENRAVVAQYAQTHGLTNSAVEKARITRKVERQYGVRSKKLKRWHTVDDLKFMLGPNAGRLDAEIDAQTTYHTVTNFILSNSPVVITDSMVSNRMASIAHYNQRMAATNELVFALASNVWKRIVGKSLTFEQAATNYSEDVNLEMGCEWGTFGRDLLADDPAVLDMLPKLKVGDITPPVESDGGLAILRLDEVAENKNFTFSRVFFKLPMFFDAETPEQVRSDLREKAEQDLIRRELDVVRKSMRIEYPSGTNLFAVGTAPLRVSKEELAD